jgi:hypothetical protein
VHCNLRKMPTQTEIPDTFTLSGNYEHRVLDAWLENAAKDDEDDAEDSGEAEPERSTYYPPRAA